MKCINKRIRKAVLFLVLTSIVLSLSGCNSTSAFEHKYKTYSFENNALAKDNLDTVHYFSKDLCVTNEINFGIDEVDSQIAKGAAVFNLTSNEVLYAQNLFGKLYPASTTKILTAYIIINECDLNSVVTISENAVDQAEDSSICGLKKGDNITVEALLYALMLYSANDAAEALAEFHSGSVEAFGKKMTEVAYELGATNSNFTNPSGLPDKNHYTTVYDMYLIFSKAIENPTFVDIISQKSKTVVYTTKDGATVERTYNNSNRYLKGTVDTPEGFQIIGGKTGTTFDAGYCLCLYSKNASGDDIISMVFKADGRYNLYLLMNQILSGFAN